MERGVVPSPRLPIRRFAGAGATKEERDELTAEFERSDIGVQESMVDYFRTQSSGGLREYLANWRLARSPGVSQEAPDEPRTGASAEPGDTSTDPPGDTGDDQGPPSGDPEGDAGDEE